jgi:hypothetical protein
VVKCRSGPALKSAWIRNLVLGSTALFQFQSKTREIDAKIVSLGKEKGDFLLVSHVFYCLLVCLLKRKKQCGGSGMFIPDPGFRIPDPGSRFLPIPDPGSRIPDPGSRIPDPKTATKDRGEKKFDIIPSYVATNFTKLYIILVLKC